MDFCRITQSTTAWFAPLIPRHYREDLTRGLLYGIGAAEEGTACGVLLFQLGETVDIMYLAVSPDYRRRGCATGMIRWLCSHAYDSCTPIFADFLAEDEEDPLYQLFTDMPEFTVGLQEGSAWTISCAELKQPLLTSQLDVHPVPFFSLPKGMQLAFREELLSKQGYSLEFHSACVPELCLCALGRGRIQAAIFVRKTGEKDLCLDYIWRAPGYTRSLLGLLGTAAQRVEGRSGTVYLSAVNPQSLRLVERLFPQAKPAGKFYEAAWDMILEGGERSRG